MTYQGFTENKACDVLTNLPVAPVGLAATDANDLDRLRQIWSHLPPMPKAVANRLDGVDRSWPGFDVRTLLSGEESGGRFSCHSLIVGPGAELPRHSLASAETYLVLIAGSLEIGVGGARRTLEAGALGFVPRGVSQSLANRSGADAELLVLHTPAGVERAFAAVHEAFRANTAAAPGTVRDVLARFGFDFSPGDRPRDAAVNTPVPRIERDIRTAEDFAALREAWTQLESAPKLVSGEAECRFLPVPGQDTWVLLEPEESAGNVSAFAAYVAKDFCAAPHHQPGEEEFFFVVDGEIRLTIGNQVVEAAPPGAFAFAPRFATHSFTNRHEKVAKLYTFNSPGGHDRGFQYAADNPQATDVLERVGAMGFQFHDLPHHAAE